MKKINRQIKNMLILVIAVFYGEYTFSAELTQDLNNLQQFISTGVVVNKGYPEELKKETSNIIKKSFDVTNQLIAKTRVNEKDTTCILRNYVLLLRYYQKAYDHTLKTLLSRFPDMSLQTTEDMLESKRTTFQNFSDACLKACGFTEKIGFQALDEDAMKLIFIYHKDDDGRYSTALLEPDEAGFFSCFSRNYNSTELDKTRGFIVHVPTLTNIKIGTKAGLYVRFSPAGDLIKFPHYHIVRQLSSAEQVRYPLCINATMPLPPLLKEIVNMPEFAENNSSIFIPMPSPEEEQQAEKEFLKMIMESQDNRLKAKAAHFVKAMVELQQNAAIGTSSGSETPENRALAITSTFSGVLDILRDPTIEILEEDLEEKLESIQGEVLHVDPPVDPEEFLTNRLFALDEAIRLQQEAISRRVANDVLSSSTQENKKKGKSGKPQHRRDRNKVAASAGSTSSSSSAPINARASGTSSRAPIIGEKTTTWEEYNKILLTYIMNSPEFEDGVNYSIKGDHLTIHGPNGNCTTLLKGAKDLPGFLARKYFSKALKKLFNGDH